MKEKRVDFMSRLICLKDVFELLVATRDYSLVQTIYNFLIWDELEI